MDTGLHPSPRGDGGRPASARDRRLRFVLRGLFLVVTAVSLYIVWPSLVDVTSAWPELRSVNPVWFVVMTVAEAASLVAIWALQATLLRTRRLRLVALAQLSSNAFGKIVPAGPAAGGALQFRMLTGGGIPATTVGGGLTAASLISTATLTVLPLLSVPAILAGAPVADGLVQAAIIGAVVFVVFVVSGATLLLTNAPLRMFGNGLGRLFVHLPGRARPASARTDLGERLVAERDLIRSTLGSSWWTALLSAALNWGFDYAALLAALVAVGASPRPSLVILAYVAAAVLAMIPLTPGGLGFVEAGLTATLVAAGIPSAQAVLAVLAYRLVSYWLPLLVGAVAGFLYNRRYGGTPSKPISPAEPS